MKRTFKGWLRRYCCALTGIETTSIKKLCQAASQESPHAREAVFLLALECKQTEKVTKYISHDSELHALWNEVSGSAINYAGKAEEFLRSRYDTLPVRFQKILSAFDSIEAGVLNDDRIVGIMAQKTKNALEQAHVSRYRLCKDLSLNEGNIYAWLAGDTSKVSRKTARKAWRYAEDLL